MAMRTVYDADGKDYVLEPVDAREYVATGRYFSAPPVEKAAEQVPQQQVAQPAQGPKSKN